VTPSTLNDAPAKNVKPADIIVTTNNNVTVQLIRLAVLSILLFSAMGSAIVFFLFPFHSISTPGRLGAPLFQA